MFRHTVHPNWLISSANVCKSDFDGLLKTMLRFLRNVLDRWLEVDAFGLAAALAYYAIFSIAPLLLLSIHLASLFLDRTTAVEALTNELISVIGPAGSDAIKQMLDAAGTAQPEGSSRRDIGHLAKQTIARAQR